MSSKKEEIINERYNKVKNQMRDSGRLIFWYDKDGKLLIVGDTKTKTRDKILKIKYNGLIYRLSITFHKGMTIGQGGHVAVHCRHFSLANGRLRKIEGNKNGVIWFEKLYLSRMGWKEHYLDTIVKKIIGGFQFSIGIYEFKNIL
jgi:hypothetical protein